jgi:hypothetical protein
MRRVLVLVGIALALQAAPVWAVSFYEDFEANVSGSVWFPWGNPPPGDSQLVTTSTNHNHTPAGSKSARANASDPAYWTGYADFGATAGKIVASAWLYEDFSNNGTNGAQPVTNMFSLYGNGSWPGVFSDYIQIGVVPFYPAGGTGYGFRTRYNDATGAGIINANVARKAGWTQLGIEVDALGDGGQIRFYIDGNQVGTSFRAGANGGAGSLSAVDLRYVRIGNNSKTYENFWYDDISVVPEPSSLIIAGLGCLGLVGYAVRRRRGA